MPKIKTWSAPNESQSVEIVKIDEKKGGQNKAKENGFYQQKDQKKAPQLFIKVEDKKGKEFSEIWTGVFLNHVLSQPGLQEYSRNFALPRPGIIEDDGGKERVAIVQDRAEATRINRLKLSEKLPYFRGKAKEKGQSFDQNEFAAILTLSVLSHDYGLHIQNIMTRNEDEESPLRCDFGSACKDIFKPGHEKNVFSSPEQTKWYKDYIELWTQSDGVKADIQGFVTEHEAQLNPDELAKMAQASCYQLWKTVYANASPDDMAAIYAHLYGQDDPSLDNPKLYGYTEKEINEKMQENIKEIAALQKEIVRLESTLGNRNQAGAGGATSPLQNTKAQGKENSKQIKAFTELKALKEKKASLEKANTNMTKFQQDFLSQKPNERVVIIQNTITKGMGEGIKQRTANLVEEGKKLDQRPLEARMNHLHAAIKEENRHIDQAKEIGNAAAYEIITLAIAEGIMGTPQKPTTGLYVTIPADTRKDREISYLSLAQLETEYSSTVKLVNQAKVQIIETMAERFHTLGSAVQSVQRAESRKDMLEKRKEKLDVEFSQKPIEKKESAMKVIGKSMQNLFSKPRSESVSHHEPVLKLPETGSQRPPTPPPPVPGSPSQRTTSISSSSSTSNAPAPLTPPPPKPQTLPPRPVKNVHSPTETPQVDTATNAETANKIDKPKTQNKNTNSL